MNEKINKIKYIQHPYAAELNKTVTALEKGIRWLSIIVLVGGIFTAVIAASGLAEWADDTSYGVVDVVVNFFGYFIELESDTFGGSPFIVFLHTGLVFALIAIALEGIRMLIVSLLKAKIHMLNCLYYTEKLTELQLMSDCDSEDKASSSQT